MASYVANGNIKSSRFVKGDTTAEGKVLVAGAGEAVLGISNEGGRRAPHPDITDSGYAAIAGENLRVYTEPDECLLCLGGTATLHALLKADSDGAGVVASTGDLVGAIALQAGIATQLIRVRVKTRDTM